MTEWHGGWDRLSDNVRRFDGGHEILSKTEHDERSKRNAALVPCHHVLTFKARKERTAKQSLADHAPEFWRMLRDAIGAERAMRFRPVSWGAPQGRVVLILTAPAEDYELWRSHEDGAALIGATAAQMRTFDSPIPAAVEEAINLAVFPDTTRILDEVIAELDKLGQEAKDPDEMPVPAPNGVSTAREYHIEIALSGLPTARQKRRFAAARVFADHIEEVATQADLALLAISSVTDDHDRMIVSLRTLEPPPGGGLSERVVRLLESGDVDGPVHPEWGEAGSLTHAMRQRFAERRAASVPAAQSTFLRPSSYLLAMRNGGTIHGGFVIVAIAALVMGLTSLAAIIPVLTVLMILNMGILPVATRALAVLRDRRAVIAEHGARGLLDATPSPRRIAGGSDTWTTLAAMCPRTERDRIARARDTCERFVRYADGRALDDDTITVLNSVQTHLPELVTYADELAREARADERDAVVSRTLAVVDAVAMDADAARDGLLQGTRDRFSTSAGFLESRTSHTLSLPEHHA